MRPYSPGGRLIACAAARGGVDTPHTQSPSFRAGTTGVSNSVRSPGFRASASGAAQQAAFATGVLPDLNAFHRYSGRSTCPYRPRRSTVSAALPRVSRGLSPPTRGPAYARFTPSNSGQRSPPTYYRGCWHVVSRGFFPGYRPTSSPGKAVYTPRGSLPHAASLGQACAHCRKFLTAASRRSLGRSQSQCGCPSSQTSYGSQPW